LTPKKKRPVARQPLPGKQKTPRVSQCEHCGYPDSSRPVWLLGVLDMEGRWGWSRINRGLFETVHERLRNFETMTWTAIQQGDSHFVPCSDIIKDARDRLAEIEQDDIDDLFSLRVQGRIRVWGIRDGAALKLLWLDPEHEVCPSLKKNT
jgi:hypothetical protein